MVNKEHLREYWKKYYPQHREQYKQHSKEYYQKHREQCQEYNRKYRQSHIKEKRERQQKVKLNFIQLLGGKCQICGYNKCLGALEFHHLNPNEKEGLRESRNKGFAEKIKNGTIRLLCANCHRELHNGDHYYNE